LRKALGERNQLKAYTIADNLLKIQRQPNGCDHGLVFSFFIQLLKYHGLKDKNQKM
jgi:DNA polymerase-3 subunit delta